MQISCRPDREQIVKSVPRMRQHVNLPSPSRRVLTSRQNSPLPLTERSRPGRRGQCRARPRAWRGGAAAAPRRPRPRRPRPRRPRSRPRSSRPRPPPPHQIRPRRGRQAQVRRGPGAQWARRGRPPRPHPQGLRRGGGGEFECFKSCACPRSAAAVLRCPGHCQPSPSCRMVACS